MKARAYYNENHKPAAMMLRELIARDIIMPGDVDERDIREVKADDIRGYTQHHFFAGIGGWSYALRLAGWMDERPVVTGSCPCQPFSSAGAGLGQADPRHLWPEWYRIICELRPAIIFGEQVERAIAHEWYDEVAADLEAQNYAVGSAVLPACAVEEAHERQRLLFMAYATFGDDYRIAGKFPTQNEQQAGERPERWLAESGGTSVVGNTELHGSHATEECGIVTRSKDEGGLLESEGSATSRAIEWFRCPDGKHRPIEHSVRLLVDGLQPRIPESYASSVLITTESEDIAGYEEIIKSFGNAIVPKLVAEFIRAGMQWN